MQTTVGLDFGTHQTKVCVEQKEGAELSYEFFTFKDNRNRKHFALPSVLSINKDHIAYGFIPYKDNGTLVRYFKQAAFTDKNDIIDKTDAIYYSIWYIAFLLFDIEEKYGNEFTIQMGVPTDGEHLEEKRELAVRILLSAYKLVEDIFVNDKNLFMATSLQELYEKTEFVSYSEEQKMLYSILVFPEAYACLMPLTTTKKIASGMSLMLDIGGGTTDISFFTVNPDNYRPMVYDFYSLNKGLNFLTDADNIANKRKDSIIKEEKQILDCREEEYKMDIRKLSLNLWNRLIFEYKKSGRPLHFFKEALKGRPLIYVGGGSTFKTICSDYDGFSDIIQISDKEWKKDAVKDMDLIMEQNLCPILSTAYGLSISVVDDDIEKTPFSTLFNGIMPNDPFKINNSGMAFDKYSAYDSED